MDVLFEKSLRTLELPRVLEKLAAQATSEAAKAKARALLPQTDVEDVKRLQQETSAACMLLGLQGSPSFAGAKDVSAALGRAQRGGMLNTRELLDIAALLRCARRVKDYRGDESDRDTVLDTMFRALHGGRKTGSPGPSLKRTRSPTTPAQNWPISAAICTLPAPAPGRSCRKSSHRPPIPKPCRRA